MHKSTITATLAILTTALSLSIAVPVRADETVPCKPIVKALREGKKPDQVATELNAPPSRVFECLRKANKVEEKRQAREHAEKVRTGSAAASPSASSE